MLTTFLTSNETQQTIDTTFINGYNFRDTIIGHPYTVNVSVYIVFLFSVLFNLQLLE